MYEIRVDGTHQVLLWQRESTVFFYEGERQINSSSPFVPQRSMTVHNGESSWRAKKKISALLRVEEPRQKEEPGYLLAFLFCS